MFGTELSALHQHTARDKLVLGTSRLPGRELGPPSLPCPGQPVASPFTSPFLGLPPHPLPGTPPGQPQDIPPMVAPAASERAHGGRGHHCPGSANSPRAEYHRAVAVRATMLVSTEKLKSETLRFQKERENKAWVSAPWMKGKMLFSFRGVFARAVLPQNLISCAVSHSKPKRLLPL